MVLFIKSQNRKLSVLVVPERLEEDLVFPIDGILLIITILLVIQPLIPK